MIQRRLRLFVVLFAVFALVLAACGPQETPTPTPEPTDIPPTEEEVIEEEPTEEIEVEETEEADADAEATEEIDAEAAADDDAVEVEVTDDAVVVSEEDEATEEADMEATEEMADMEMDAVSAAYMLITNNGEEDITLVSANAEIAGITEVHQTIIENDVARMEEMTDGIVIPAGETVALEPGGFHVMLLELEDDLREGETTSITLEFDNGETITVDAPVSNVAPDEGETYEVGDLTIEVVWARPTAAMDQGIMGEVDVTEEAEDIEAPEDASAEMEETEAADMEATEEMGTIVDIASASEDFTILVDAVVAADLAETLSGGEFTVFAPTNAAFEAALESLGLTAEELLADTELLTSVLTYHVVEGTVLAEAVLQLDGEEVVTVNGASLTVGVTDDGVTLTDGQGNTVNVIQTDLIASNGVIHVIDGVLLPPVADDMEATEEMADVEATEVVVVELTTYEGVYSFDYPADFDVLESATFDLVTLTRGDQRIVVVGPDAYNAILGAQEFESDSEQLAFYLDRAGYEVGEETTMMMGLASYEIALPRNNQVGAATLIDLDNGRRGVIIELGPDADNVPGAEGAGIMESIVYPADIVDVAVSTEGFSTLVAAVQAAGLEDTLRSGEFTVFAPTDDAFAAALESLGVTAEDLLADTELLTSILTYHVVEGVVTSDMLEDGMEVTTVNGATLTVNVAEDGVTITDANGNTYSVTLADVAASNGVIHVIDGVLLPPLEEAAEEEMAEEEVADAEATEEAEATDEASDMGGDLPTIAGAAVETPDLSTLASAVLATDLFETLDSEGAFTVFAPTNDAFNAALEALDMEFGDLTADTELLTSVLTYHVVEGVVTSDMLEDGMEVTTVNGATLTVNVSDEGVTVTDANGNTYNVVTPDVMASNGVVHVIDGVLLPPME